MAAKTDAAKRAEVEKVQSICERAVAEASCQIYDLKIAAYYRVELTIERIPGTPPIDEIVKIHKKISHAMEDAGCDWMKYVIDVTTPGVNREFRSPDEFSLFLGKRVRVKRLNVPPAELLVIGELKAADATGFTLREDDGKVTEFLFTDIEGGRLEPRLPF